jgi:anaerobic ribonucleoside-triphosphate reductase activating protein
MTMSIRSVIKIRCAQIRSLDLSNGEGVGVSIFVQGCHFHCKNCFNPETWDFNGGKEWTEEVKEKFLELANRPYIKRISILGGEPLAEENLEDVLDLVNKFRLLFPQKSIWLYSGYSWSDIWCNDAALRDDYGLDYCEQVSINHIKRQQIITQCDVFIDGRYMDSQRDITLPYRGSKNQHIIDVKRSLQKGEMVLWDV